MLGNSQHDVGGSDKGADGPRDFVPDNFGQDH